MLVGNPVVAPRCITRSLVGTWGDSATVAVGVGFRKSDRSCISNMEPNLEEAGIIQAIPDTYPNGCGTSRSRMV